MDLDIRGLRVLVTAGASGIRLEIARAFVREGARVHVTDIDRAALDGLAASDPDLTHSYGDVSDRADAAHFFDEALHALGGLDVLVSNAGAVAFGHFLEVGPEDFDRTIAVNLRGVFLGCKYAVPALLEAGGGSIVNTGSVNSLVAEPFLTAYCASKGGVLMLSRAVALDYAARGIRCNCLCPGWVDTPINHPHAERMGGLEGVLESLPEWQPIGRQGYPEEIAGAAAYLASDESAFMTGSAFVIDGAMTAR